MIVDREPTVRQLYPIAELGKPADLPTRAPNYMRLVVADFQPRIDGHCLDFRDEVMAQIFDDGQPMPARTLVFNIEVCDEGAKRGNGFYLRRSFSGWKRIGQITFDNAVVSFNGDHVIHFNHPTWRNDRNDPSTATRVRERNIR